jgi:ribonuclease Z
MSKVIILGTSYSIPDEDHENTHLLVSTEDRVILVDCVGSTFLRLKKVGFDFNQLSDMVLTHFHPDHVSGVPSLLMDMWLMGRRKPLNIYGLHHTLDRIEDTMGFYDWDRWPGFFPVSFFRMPDESMTGLIDTDSVKVFGSPVCHLIPTIGLRFEFPLLHKVVAYSCDTEPCQAVVRLAEEADILIHESTGASLGHSSARQAGEVASQAKVKSLYLIHYPTINLDQQNLLAEARQSFLGTVNLAYDFQEITL